MSTAERSNVPGGDKTRPAGVDGDGLDSYPTYHDGRTPPHLATTSKPTDVDLPRSQRSYGLPILIGLIAFALVIIAYLAVGGMNMAASTDEALTPEDGAANPAVSGAAPQPAGDAGPGTNREAAGTLDRDVQPQTQTSPGAVETTPGSIDVPGGATTAPIQEAPAR